jgi:transketolase
MSTSPSEDNSRAERDMANAIRALAMDAVQKANSGHPGMPMGMAEIAVALWGRHLRHNPANPSWPNRDRFVLSNGHGSMLLYALLHLTGYELPIEELARFRQLHSKTPGHPEYRMAPGVETTTGPLGQGLANAVGMALAERVLAAEFNRPGLEIVDHHTYVFAGDGCMMEGISHEACSLAGTLGLGKLIAFYDDNSISIDSEKGHIGQWFTEDVPRRFEAYGWQVLRGIDGHDVEAVDRAIRKAKRDTRRPSLVCCKTTIAKGAPTKANTGSAHGSPLGDKEVEATRAAIGWPHAPFQVPQEVLDSWNATAQGAKLEKKWARSFRRYEREHPVLAREFRRRVAGRLPEGWADHCQRQLDAVNGKAETIATRKASQNALEALGPVLPELLGGSADLAASNLTLWSGSKPVGKGDAAQGGGNYVFYGVREFGMCAVMNGVSLHGGLLPYGGTFLTFSDYARNALRMAALMAIGPILVFTHDSIGLGEDGPTHQPVEHAATLRLIPNMDVWRPADSVETLVAWIAAVERSSAEAGGGPSSLLLSRQNLPFVPRDARTLGEIRRGGYVLSDAVDARAIILATGSELQLALGARDRLAAEGVAVRVVSMPSTSVFDRQPEDYRRSVLNGLPILAVEAGVADFWWKYAGGVYSGRGAVLGMDRFGESAPAGELFKFFGFTVDKVVEKVKRLV